MNVLFIAIDTLRADRMSCYGHWNLTSPNLDRLAEESVLFEKFFAPHIPTHPGFTTMFTSRDVWDHMIVSQGASRELDEAIPTLPQILQEHGYFTAAADNLGRWFRRGYDVYEGYMWDRNPEGAWRKGEAVNETAFKLLDTCASQDKPWFLYLHYWDPHTPYLPPPPFDRMFYHGNEKDPNNPSMKDVWKLEAFSHYFNEWMPGCTDIKFPCMQYDAEIAYGDACVAHVLHKLREQGLADDTLIVVTSDHGEELDEHDLWFDHHGVYDTNLWVPLILHHRDLPSGLRIPGWATHLDLAPTILDLLGLDFAAQEAGMQGTSLVPWMQGSRGGDVHPVLFCTECTWTRRWCVKTKQWHYIESAEPDPFGKPDRELYDLTIDPGQHKNLAEQRPDVVAKMHDLLWQHIEARKAATGNPDPVETGSITLRQVGNVNVAVPDDQVLDEQGHPDGGVWEDPTSRRLYGMGYL
ncbi:MAG: sulfatase [Armatimonadetes bacterium]|nr:sulfatase [Armatimonadota bacterium]